VWRTDRRTDRRQAYINNVHLYKIPHSTLSSQHLLFASTCLYLWNSVTSELRYDRAFVSLILISLFHCFHSLVIFIIHTHSFVSGLIRIPDCRRMNAFPVPSLRVKRGFHSNARNARNVTPLRCVRLNGKSVKSQSSFSSSRKLDSTLFTTHLRNETKWRKCNIEEEIVIFSRRIELTVVCWHDEVEVRTRTDSCVSVLWLFTRTNGSSNFRASPFGKLHKFSALFP